MKLRVRNDRFIHTDGDVSVHDDGCQGPGGGCVGDGGTQNHKQTTHVKRPQILQ